MNLKILLKAIKKQDINNVQIVIISLPFILFLINFSFEYLWILIISVIALVLAVMVIYNIIKGVREKYPSLHKSPENHKYLKDGDYTFKYKFETQKIKLKNGKKEGEVLIFNNENILIRKEMFENGKLIGDIVEFYSNKNKRMVYTFDELLYKFYDKKGNKMFSVHNIEDFENSVWSIFDNNKLLTEKIYINGKKAEKLNINKNNEKVKAGVYNWKFEPGRDNAKYEYSKYVNRLIHKGVSITSGWMGPPGAPGYTNEFYKIHPVQKLGDLLILK